MLGGACGPAMGAALGVPLPTVAVPIMTLLAGVVGLAIGLALVISEELKSRLVNACFIAGGVWAIVGAALFREGQVTAVGGVITLASAAVMVSLHHLAQRAGPGIAVAHLFMFAGMASGGLVGGILHDRLLVPGLAMGGWLTLLQFFAFACFGRARVRLSS